MDELRCQPNEDVVEQLVEQKTYYAKDGHSRLHCQSCRKPDGAQARIYPDGSWEWEWECECECGHLHTHTGYYGPDGRCIDEDDLPAWEDGIEDTFSVSVVQVCAQAQPDEPEGFEILCQGCAAFADDRIVNSAQLTLLDEEEQN